MARLPNRIRGDGDRTWKKSAATIGASWQSGRHSPPAGMPVQLADDPEAKRTLVLSPDLELIGVLRQRLNPERCGLTLASVGSAEAHVNVTYLGPDKLLAA